MQDDRLRVPVDKDYLEALGLAAYAFSGLEWTVVHSCEVINPGCIHALIPKTAGAIAKEFQRLVRGYPDPVAQPSLISAAEEFGRLVKLRNAILHANPGTTPEGHQRLFRNGVALEIADLNSAADDFAAAGVICSELYHHVLKK